MKSTMKLKLLASALLASTMAAAPAFAKVDQAQADKLGGSELTPTGAEVAGNADGTIPAWDGGLKKPPACWDGSEFMCNPYPDDKPLFTITAANMDQYKDKLSPGQIAMFKRYPDTYRMPVYKTRRSFAIPDHVAKLTKKNAAETETVGATGLKNLNVLATHSPFLRMVLKWYGTTSRAIAVKLWIEPLAR